MARKGRVIGTCIKTNNKVKLQPRKEINHPYHVSFVHKTGAHVWHMQGAVKVPDRSPDRRTTSRQITWENWAYLISTLRSPLGTVVDHNLSSLCSCPQRDYAVP